MITYSQIIKLDRTFLFISFGSFKIINSSKRKQIGKKLKNIHFSIAISQFLIFLNFLSNCNKCQRLRIGRLFFKSDAMLAKMKHVSYPFEYVIGNSNANVLIHRNNRHQCVCIKKCE